MSANINESIEQIKERIAGDYKDLSNVSILRHMQDVVAVAYRYLLDLFAVHRVELQEFADSMVPGTILWYRDQLLLFQSGYELEIIDFRPAYSVIDEEARIVAYAHVKEMLGGIMCKVAKADRTELFTVPELNAIDAYMKKIKHPGTAVLIVNQPGDAITIEVDVEINKELIDEDGKLIGTTTYPVKDGIIDYINDGEFGGILTMNAMIDTIQSINGVELVRLKLVSATTHTLVDTVIFDLSEGINLMSYESEAGYMVLDEADLTINYL
jgi:hypothetical protein